MEKKDLKSMTLEELTEFVKELGEKPFRAKQLYQWMHEKLAASLDECTNLPKAFREKLAENSTYTSLRTVKMLEWVNPGSTGRDNICLVSMTGT